MPYLSNSLVSGSDDKDVHSDPILEDRKTLGHWASQRVEKGELRKYQALNNFRSLDGLGGLKAARRDRGQILWLEDARVYLKRLLHQWDAILLGVVLALFFMLMSHALPTLTQRFQSRKSVV